MRQARSSALLSSAIALAMAGPCASAADTTNSNLAKMPETPAAAADLDGTAAITGLGDREPIRKAHGVWAHAVGVTPTGEHQKHIIGAFVAADLDMNGMLTVEEYRSLVDSRASYMYDRAAGTKGIEVGPREELTAFAMADIAKQFKIADRNKDSALTFHEVYYFETFDRPSAFPAKPESIPQDVSGHWEQLTVKDHPAVYDNPPFSPARHKQAMESGGFAAVDGNNDGVVSIFEASDYSLLTWTPAVHAYAGADANDDALLTKEEFSDFKQTISAFQLQAERPGSFPSGRQ